LKQDRSVTVCTVEHIHQVGQVTMYGMKMYKTDVNALTPKGNRLLVQILYLDLDDATNLKVGDKFVYSA